MKSSTLRYLISFILVLFFMIPFLAIGRQFRLALLPDKGDNFSCGTCHVRATGGGGRNPFGEDWAAIAIPKGDKYVPELADKDSDGDGFTNDKEFEAETNPGDAKSKLPEEKPKSVNPKGKRYIPWGRIK
ncbi:thrombospondin type 3 repeat-containing protein [Candidatus Poribacteria bacterium]